ncbi:MAG TPA: hypothetical protein DCO75_04210 [Fibrobacteres bacterium]|nr:hypothetical protein [Fibrobacterota bacterium]
MMNKEDPRYIWVSVDENIDADGSYDNPFSSISRAVELAQPGQTVILKQGKYIGDLTVQSGGTMDKPLRIMAEDGADVRIAESCWYFYDVTDIICSGIEFLNSPGMSIAVMGKCERNRFEFLKFINCSIAKESAGTLFFGGSGHSCNIVESCCFEHTPDIIEKSGKTGVSAGIMIANGDLANGEANRNHIISKNRISGYDYGILLGSSDSAGGECGHRVVYNTIERCGIEGIMVRCGDTLVKGNIVRNCANQSISIAIGAGSFVEDNRIVDCGNGISINGKGHTVANNCIVRCDKNAVRILSNKIKDLESASNAVVEQNTIVLGENAKGTGIVIEPGTTCIVRKNLFHGKGRPYCFDENRTDVTAVGTSRASGHFIMENFVSGLEEDIDGCNKGNVSFVSEPFDNYTNESGWGAQGWVLSPEAFDPEKKDSVEYDNGALANSHPTEEEIAVDKDFAERMMFME